MADQDFTINIRTTANTAGVEQIRAALGGLGAQVQSINAASGGSGGVSLIEKTADKIEHGIFRTAAHAAGIALVYEFAAALKSTGEQIDKITDELDKQGEQLVKNARLYSEASKFATTEADIIKIGNAALKDVETTHKRVTELQKLELTYWQQFIDSIGKGGFIGVGPIQQAVNAAQETAAKQAASTQNTAYLDILAGKTTLARHAAQSYEETVAELTARMKEQQALADTHFANKDAQSYLAAAANAENYRKELEALKTAHDKLTDKTQKFVDTADPQVRAILANEKAMFEARAAGRGRDADLYEKSALALRRGATPQQQGELEKIYTSPALIDALNNNTQAVRNNTELWK